MGGRGVWEGGECGREGRKGLSVHSGGGENMLEVVVVTVGEPVSVGGRECGREERKGLSVHSGGGENMLEVVVVTVGEPVSVGVSECGKGVSG